MKLAQVTALTLSAIGLVLTTSTYANASDIEKFQKLYDDFHNAVTQRDRAKIFTFIAPGFVSIELSGKSQTADQMIDDTLALPKGLIPQTPTTLVLSAIGDGKIEEVDQSYHNVKTKFDSKGIKSVFEFNARSHDTWIFTDGKWLFKSSRTDELEMMKDGIEIMHQKRPAT